MDNEPEKEALLTRMSWIQHLIYRISKRLYYAIYVKTTFQTELNDLLNKYNISESELVEKVADMYPREFEAEAEKSFRDQWDQEAIDNQDPPERDPNG